MAVTNDVINRRGGGDRDSLIPIGRLSRIYVTSPALLAAAGNLALVLRRLDAGCQDVVSAKKMDLTVS